MVAVGRGRNLDCSLSAIRNQEVCFTEECVVRDLDVAVVTILFPPLMPQTVTRMFSLWSRKPQQTVAESVEQVCCAYHLLGEPCAGNISASLSSHIHGTEPFTVRFFMTYAFSCMTPYVVVTHSLGSFAHEQLWSDRPPPAQPCRSHDRG